MRLLSPIRGIFVGKHNIRQAVMDGLLVMIATVAMIGLLFTAVYYFFALMHRGDVPDSVSVHMTYLSSLTPVIGPLLSSLFSFGVIIYRFRKTPDYALIQSQYISLSVGMFAAVGYFYFEQGALIFSWTWLVTTVVMAFCPFLMAIIGRRLSHASDGLGALETLLSPRELDVVKLVQDGLSNKEVSEALFISEETVKTHLKRVYRKMGVSKRLELVKKLSEL